MYKILNTCSMPTVAIVSVAILCQVCVSLSATRTNVCPEDNKINARIAEHLGGRLVSTDTGSYGLISPYLLKKFHWRSFSVTGDKIRFLAKQNDSMVEMPLSELQPEEARFVSACREKAFERFGSSLEATPNGPIVSVQSKVAIKEAPRDRVIEPKWTIFSKDGTVINCEWAKMITINENGSMLTYNRRDEWTFCERIMPREWTRLFVLDEMITVIKTDGSLLMQPEYFYGGMERDYLAQLFDRMDEHNPR